METITQINKSIVNNLFATYFGNNFQSDENLETFIDKYIKAEGLRKSLLKDLILHWFIDNKPDEYTKDDFAKDYKNFIKNLDKKSEDNISNDMPKI